MKSERRHQLQTNELANQAGHLIETATPYFRYGAIAVVGLVLIGIAYGVWHTQNEQRNAMAWSDYYFKFGSPTKVKEVYEDFPTSSANGWAMQNEADTLFVKAMNEVYIDRPRADENLNIAKKNYEKILAGSPAPTLRIRATLGLAQAYESLGDSDKAIETYKKLTAVPGVMEALTTECKKRIEWLESESGKSFFAWYKQFNPLPAPDIKIPGLNQLPGAPDMEFKPTSNPPANNPPANSELPSLQPTNGQSLPALPEQPAGTAPASTAPTSTAPAGTPTEQPLTIPPPADGGAPANPPSGAAPAETPASTAPTGNAPPATETGNANPGTPSPNGQ